MMSSHSFQNTRVTIDFMQPHQHYPSTIHHIPTVTMTTSLHHNQNLDDPYLDNRDQPRNYSHEGFDIPGHDSRCCLLPGCTLNTDYQPHNSEKNYESKVNGVKVEDNVENLPSCAFSGSNVPTISSVLAAMQSNNASVYNSLPVISGKLAEKILNEDTDSGYNAPNFTPSPVLQEIPVEEVEYFLQPPEEVFVKPEPVAVQPTKKTNPISENYVTSTKTSKNEHQCPECERVFSNQSNLRIHMRVHTGDRPYKCDFCNKAFAQRATLNTHRRTHTGEKPFKCDQCIKSFSDLSTFNKHKRKHTGERPYTCTICQKSFTQSGNMLRHMKTHR